MYKIEYAGTEKVGGVTKFVTIPDIPVNIKFSKRIWFKKSIIQVFDMIVIKLNLKLLLVKLAQPISVKLKAQRASG